MVTLRFQIADSRRARHLPAILLCALSSLALADQVRVTGTVTDPTGAAIISARITIHSAHKTETVQTDSAGRFEFADLSDLTGTLDVTAKGFASVTQEWSFSSTSAELVFVLHPLG